MCWGVVFKGQLRLPSPFIQHAADIDFSFLNLKVFWLDKADIAQLHPVSSKLFNRRHRRLLHDSIPRLSGGKALKKGRVAFVQT